MYFTRANCIISFSHKIVHNLNVDFDGLFEFSKRETHLELFNFHSEISIQYPFLCLFSPQNPGGMKVF